MTSGRVRATVATDYGVAAAAVAPGVQPVVGHVAGPAYEGIGRDSDALARIAADALRLTQPHLSAATPHATWQIGLAVLLACALPIALAMSTRDGATAISVLMSVPFLTIVVIRAAALWQLLRTHSAPAGVAPDVLPNDALPFYSVLVPVYCEHEVAPALVQALCKLDYPTDRLEILFLTEANDPETRAALNAARRPPHMHILTVPAGFPQTKPRALNYALQSARGELIAVFDAEDVPAPRQLRQAAEMFAAAGSSLSCVQARLGIYNSHHGFLARQFSLEYAALFEAILPALERLGLPILLGGTSNHFRRVDLEAVGAWDAYNVTEDADLGLRLARAGKRVAMLASDTWEEAPGTWTAWRGQRTRWLKGWMQTYLVHTRHPRALLSDLGAWRTAGANVLLGGMILSALIHPWFYAAAAYKVMQGEPVFGGDNAAALFCQLTFAAGYSVGIVLGLIAAWRSEGRIPLVSALLVPFYWLAISLAAYRSLWEFKQRPFHWEKTPHMARPLSLFSDEQPVSETREVPSA